MRLGITGLPNVGKSTLFNTLTNSKVSAENYPFCTIEPNVGIVHVPDKRIDSLSRIFDNKKLIYAPIEFFDIAGLVKGASSGEGLGNRFLSHIRSSDAIVHVVRCFDDPNIVHVEQGTDPVRDIEIINLELIMSDIEIVSKRIEKVKKAAKSGDKHQKEEVLFFERLLLHLDGAKPASSFQLKDEEEHSLATSLSLLTTKPVLYVANIAESDIGRQDIPALDALINHVGNDMVKVLPLCLKAEAELLELSEEERNEYLEVLGLMTSGLDKLIYACYELLGLISFITVGNSEIRAWTIKNGTKAQQAAGRIHTDFEKGFIRAEVISAVELVECGSYATAREKGLVRSEGRDYFIKDGEVVLFRFNV